MDKIKIAILSETFKELKIRNKKLKFKRAFLMGFSILLTILNSLIVYLEEKYKFNLSLLSFY